MKVYYLMSLALIGAVLAHGTSARADQDTLNASLRHAARLGLLTDVQKTLAEGAQVDGMAPYGETALQYAALYGHTRVVQELLREGADINHRDFDDNTPLLVAAHNCNPRTVAVLVRSGARPNSQNHHGSTALILAAEQNCVKTIRILLEAPGINVLIKDDWDKNAIDYAGEALLSIETYDADTWLKLKQAAKPPTVLP